MKTRQKAWLLVICLSLANGVAANVRRLTSNNPQSEIDQSLLTLAATPFSILQRDGIAWLAKPNGERFFSFGVCVLDQGPSREKFNPTNPAYAAWQHYSDSNQWAEATVQRLKSWGFTTIGGWSDFRTLRQVRDPEIFFTPVLHLGSTAGAPWWDMWDPKNLERMEEVARQKIVPLRDDPRVIGYYSDNEMGWWNATLFKMTLEQAPTSRQRQRLLKLLRDAYQNDWPKLLKDFDPEGATNFEELDQRGLLYLRPGSKGIQVLRRFLGLMAERYYSLMQEIIRRHDPRALVLGDRYQSFYYPEVARASAPYVDAASGNLNASWNDGTFPRFYLDTLHALTGKPIFVSEFYMAARENRSGNKNDSGVFPVVATQKERATGFRTTLQALLKIPYVVGADWFQYYDEPTHGRADGENFNFGLVDIHNRPYEPLTKTAAALDLDALKARPHVARPDASQGVPPAPPEPFKDFKPTLAIRHWDRERGFVKPISEFPVADLYICWNRKAIYLGLSAQDMVEDACYRDKIVPESDRAQWLVRVGDGGPTIHVRIGAGKAPVIDGATVLVTNVSGVNLHVRNIACMELPAKLFGESRFKRGDKIQFTSTLLTHCAAYRVEWGGRFRLAD